MLLATCMMAMGKLWDEAAKTAGASETSFLSKNSAAEKADVKSHTVIQQP